MHLSRFPRHDDSILRLPLGVTGQRALRQARQARQPRRPCRRASASAARRRRRARRQARPTSSPATWPHTPAARCRPRRRRLRPPPARPRWVLPPRLLLVCTRFVVCLQLCRGSCPFFIHCLQVHVQGMFDSWQSQGRNMHTPIIFTHSEGEDVSIINSVIIVCLGRRLHALWVSSRAAV